MTTPVFPQVDPVTGALPAFTEARYAASGATTTALAGKATVASVTAAVAAAAADAATRVVNEGSVPGLVFYDAKPTPAALLADGVPVGAIVFTLGS